MKHMNDKSSLLIELTSKSPKKKNVETFFDKYFFKIDSSLRKALRKKHESSDKSSKRVATQKPNTCSAWSLRSDRARVKKLGRYVATELKPMLCRYVATRLKPELGRYVATELEPKFGRYVATEWCMPSSTRSNKDKHLLFSEDPTHLERTICKDQRSISLDAAAFTSTDSRTQPSTDTRPSSSTDLHHSTLIDNTRVHRSIIIRETWSETRRSGECNPDTDATGATQPVEEDARPRALADYNRPDEIDRPHEPAIDRQRETDIDRPPSPPIDRRTPLTYRVRLPSIDSNRINALRPPPKPLANPPEPTTNPLDTTPEPMQVDEGTEGRRLRKRKEKIPKNLKREANEKEMDAFT
ncbi:hypothetical protein F2Q69_00053013 [Brassica cretica]|uniref:Uncharacterized protein n=1 Tax=Brassica cretica TaxID=69181 RepID=A0A8S9MVQ9_BRACR|nr:hypothetical protein F2Q69_00053013 [Brassica cretica]